MIYIEIIYNKFYLIYIVKFSFELILNFESNYF